MHHIEIQKQGLKARRVVMKKYGLYVLFSIGFCSVGLWANDATFYSYNTYPSRIVTETIGEGGYQHCTIQLILFFKRL